MICFDNVKFIIIVICFINTLTTSKVVLHKADINLLRLGMFFTVLSDYFLILTTQHIYGLISFSLVQIIYNYRYSGLAKLPFQLLYSIATFIIAYLILDIGLIISLGLMYSVLFCYSFVSAIRAYKKYPKPNNVMIILGMGLFGLCDINVALYGLSLYSISTLFYHKYIDFIFFAIWLFYIPSQIMLSLSGRSYTNFS